MGFAIPPIVAALVRDQEISWRDARVFVSLCDLLDVVALREVKLLVISQQTGIDRGDVSRSLKRLVERGYLVRGARGSAGGPWTYRIPFTRVTPHDESAA